MLNVEKIKEIMKAREFMNTSQLAKKIGISPQHLSNVLSGSRGLSTESLKALSQVLDVDVSEILKDIPTNEPTISVQEDGRIIVEKINRTRVTLPSNEESYGFIRQLVTENDELDNKIQMLLLKADKETKEKILGILEVKHREQS